MRWHRLRVIVKTVTDNGGRKSYNTLWFDNYGAKEKSVTTMDMGGGMGDAEWVTISLEDGNSYMLDNTRKTATVMKRQDVNYLDMPEKVAKARKAKVIGEETIGGRKCVKWEEHVKQILHTSTVVSWVWKGIPIQYNHPDRNKAAQINRSQNLRDPERLQAEESVTTTASAVPSRRGAL